MWSTNSMQATHSRPNLCKQNLFYRIVREIPGGLGMKSSQVSMWINMNLEKSSEILSDHIK